MAENSEAIKIYRNICPRNCFNSCAMLSYVKDGQLLKVEGDPSHGYTKGRLCAKGYAYRDYVYSPHRLRYPLRQYPRGSGNWQRISWDEALTLIAEKLIELNRRYGSNLSAAYNSVSGNIGVLHQATAGMFNGLGPHTKPTGNACLAAGLDAISYDYGPLYSRDPESMANSRLIVIWGANPAWTAVHQFHYINQARARGAKLVVIDPIYTPTAAKADLYIQINPGTDGLLALAVAKLLIEGNHYDAAFIAEKVEGWQPFKSYVTEMISLDTASEVTGVPIEGIRELASLYKKLKPCANWVGLGMQRHTNGGQNVRAINALNALTGNFDLPGGGLFYTHPGFALLPLNIVNFYHESHSMTDGSASSAGSAVAKSKASPLESRVVNINEFADQVLSLDDPPVKFLWVANRNPITQDQGVKSWKTLLEQLEMVVTVDLFMTHMAEVSDIVLPAASHFEDYDLNVSYWHYWIGFNDRALPPYYQAKSDLEIARALTKKLNELSPGFSSFPAERSALEWIEQEFTPEVLSQYDLKDWQELRHGPVKLKASLLAEGELLTKSGKLELYSREAKKHSLPAIPKFTMANIERQFPLVMLSPQQQFRLHSQYGFIPSLQIAGVNNEQIVRMNPHDAEVRGIRDGDSVLIYNKSGAIKRQAVLSSDVARGVIVVFQGGSDPANRLLEGLFTDMGEKETGTSGLAYYDAIVEVRRVGVNE